MDKRICKKTFENKNFKNQTFRRIFFHPIKLPTCEIKSFFAGTGKKQKGRHVTEENRVR